MMPMTTPGGAHGEHFRPEITSYLDDLDAALAHADPRERAEVIAGITEHINQALGPDASSDDVSRVLEGLGSVESIAAEVNTGAVVAVDSVPKWVLPTSYGLAVCSLFFVLVPFVSIPLATAALIVSRHWWRRTGALPVRTAMVASWIALGVAFLFVVIVIVGVLAFAPMTSEVTPAVPAGG